MRYGLAKGLGSSWLALRRNLLQSRTSLSTPRYFRQAHAPMLTCTRNFAYSRLHLSDQDSTPPTTESLRARLYAEIQKSVKGHPLAERENLYLELHALVDAVESDSEKSVTETLSKIETAEVFDLAMKLIELQGHSDTDVGALASRMAAQLLRISSEREHPDAMFGFANIQRKGLFGIKQDTQSSIKLLTSLAKQGHRFAQFVLGEIYFNGENISNSSNDANTDDIKPARRYDLALSLFEVAAQNKMAGAYLYIGEIYAAGLGVDADLPRAIDYFKMGAEESDPHCCMALGQVYSTAGPEQSYHDAFEWHMKASDLGNLAGAYNVGTHYFGGRGTNQDFSKAAEYWAKAADGGFTHAMVNLANLFVEGRGVEQDLYRARDYYRKASEKDAQAKILLLELEEVIRKDEAGLLDK
eukprot:CFRG6499T1